MIKRILFLLCAIATLAALAGCGSGQSGGAAAQTVSGYLNALAAKDEAKLTSLVCPDFEPQALLELDLFQATETRLDGLSCQTSGGATDSAAQVRCQGKIVARYVDQTQEFDLSGRVYSLEKTGENWLVCGYNEE